MNRNAQRQIASADDALLDADPARLLKSEGTVAIHADHGAAGANDAVPFDDDIDPDVLRWMPVAVPMLAVLLCACIGAIWYFVL